jgi:hypothetical protein
LAEIGDSCYGERSELATNFLTGPADNHAILATFCETFAAALGGAETGLDAHLETRVARDRSDPRAILKTRPGEMRTGEGQENLK